MFGGPMMQMLGVTITSREVGTPKSKPTSANVRPNIQPHMN
jgi:hypothetical protein